MTERSRVTAGGVLLSRAAGVEVERAQAALDAHPEWKAKLRHVHVYHCACGATCDDPNVERVSVNSGGAS